MIKHSLIFLIVSLLCASCGTVYENYTAKEDDAFIVADLFLDDSASQQLLDEMQIELLTGYCARQTHLVTKYTLCGPYYRYNKVVGGYEVYIPFVADMGADDGLSFVRRYSFKIVLGNGEPKSGAIARRDGKWFIRSYFDDVSSVSQGKLIVLKKDGVMKIEVGFQWACRSNVEL